MPSKTPRELPVPPAAAPDAGALEILRVWAAGGQQHVTINTDLWDDPGNWGLMLVDLARHVANAYSQAGKFEKETALALIRLGFDAEWSYPTDEVVGHRVSVILGRDHRGADTRLIAEQSP